ncbi:MAG: DUF59 domain-containing protein [Burkholderiales bacterium]|nr:DUF59 domain-containing protein [Phycisphaerae bacterium]
MNEPTRKSLGVINPNDKVQQLRNAFAEDAPARGAGDPLGVAPASKPSQQVVQDQIISALRTVYDPEIPVNVYDLGLIYAIDVADDNAVKITMTLTAPGCPVAGQIVADVETKVENVDAVKSCTVDLVFEPSWTKERMSEAALLELGLI